MAFSQDQLDALDEALATGHLTVEYRDRKVTYRSLVEMMQLRSTMVKALASESERITGRFTPNYSKGL